jgi:CheY-like chemotaxis protein
VARNAPVALRLAADFQPDVALLDIGLPVMDRYELAARPRELPGLNRMKLIALTGYGQESDRRKSQEAGFDHRLVKRVDLLLLESDLAESTQQRDEGGA